MDWFAFKKIVGPLLFPLPVCMALLSMGLILLWFTKKQKAGKVFMSAGTLLLLLFSFEPFSDWTLDTLEQDYPTYTPPASPDSTIQWIVVLAAGMTHDLSLSSNDQLTATTLSRLVEGIRILRYHSAARLILSGGPPAWSSATVMKETALMLGIDPGRIVLESQSQDTKDEAVLIKTIVGADAFILVTSATHMPRSMALFEKQGLSPVPAPTAHQARGLRPLPVRYYPTSNNLADTRIAFYEYLGRLWAKLRGQV